MINVIDKHNCCGCSACVQSCPKQCISFDEDDQGFRYPLVNKELCIDCGLCEKVCPCLNQNVGSTGSPTARKPLKVYAAISLNEDIRMKSSSGGIFTMLAEAIIDEGGVVFGARFDENWEVIHDYTEAKEGLAAFRGSKYVQSRIGKTYIQTRDFLKQGRKVLFSGTSCQIAGLEKFLRKEYDNLMTVDVVCHGVPSPLIWRKYLAMTKNVSELTSISMKDKSTGWRQYSYTFETISGKGSELAKDNKYQLAFTQNLILRLSCFNCPAKAGKSGSDITLADYWGIEHIAPQIDDNKGTSFVCANTSKGVDYISKLSLTTIETNYDDSIPFNSCIVNSTIEPVERVSFWQTYSQKGIDALLALKPYQQNIIKRIIKRIFRR